jgi:hypothetical protein
MASGPTGSKYSKKYLTTIFSVLPQEENPMRRTDPK